MTTDPYESDRAREAAAVLHLRANRATPGPWRLSHSRYGALVADQPHPYRRDPNPNGWGWDEGYGGCLIAESMMTADRVYLATVSPIVGHHLADVIEGLAPDANDFHKERARRACRAIVDTILGVIPAGHQDES